MAATSEVIAEPGKPTIIITRWFDAPRRLVFEACTRPELVKRWWGPHGTSLAVCEIDLRVGGRWRFVIRGADGHDSGFAGVYREIAPDRIVQTFVYDPFPDAEAVETLELAEIDGRTKLTVTVVHKTVEARDGHIAAGMEPGLQETHQRLDAVLRTMQQAA